MPISRRTFLTRTSRVAAVALLAPDRLLSPATNLSAAEGRLGQLTFLDEGPVPPTHPRGEGLAGRLALDLATLREDSLVTSNEKFFIRTRVPDRLPPTDSWSVALDGLDGGRVDLGIGELRRRSVDQGVHLLECAGNGSHRRWGLLSSAQWSGVSVAEILEARKPRAGASRVLIEGNDDHSRESAGSVRGAGWIFTPEQLADSGAFLATAMNGQALPPDHGFPVRLLVPGWYGCCCAKWIESIRWVSGDEPATSQMREYATRTHQGGVPDRASDYRPAEVDLAAMPVRIEVRPSGSEVDYEVVGIVWGGKRTTERLEIRFGGGRWIPVERYAKRTHRTWGFWSHRWRPRPGRYDIALRVDDPAIPTRRLDRGYYRRSVEIPQSSS